MFSVPWEILALGVALLVLGVSALIMAIKTRRGPPVILEGGIDIQALAEAVAKAVGKEIAKELKEALGSLRFANGTSSYQQSDSGIQMDDRIIPMKVDVSGTEANLQNMAKEEVKVDKDLDKNKSKLANLFKKKE
jgi:hypothetical protein